MITQNFREVTPITVRETAYKGKTYPVTGVTVRWLTHKNLGGEEYQHNHALRHFTIAPGGEIPVHAHQFTQIMYVLSGKLVCRVEAQDGRVEEKEVGPGDCVYLYSFEPHGIANRSAEPAVMLCCIDCVGDKSNCIPTI
jgi:quercetin dioxygenase-like cupin family protein